MIEDLDISVHCDVYVFEWLVRFLSAPREPKLDLQSVISILISAEFLGIDDLVEKCLVYVTKHLEEVIKLPIDLSCLNQSLIDRLAAKVGLAELATLVDPKDKLTGKMYQKKLIGLLQEDEASDEESLRLCTECNQLFTKANAENALCPSPKVFIDVYG